MFRLERNHNYDQSGPQGTCRKKFTMTRMGKKNIIKTYERRRAEC